MIYFSMTGVISMGISQADFKIQVLPGILYGGKGFMKMNGPLI